MCHKTGTPKGTVVDSAPCCSSSLLVPPQQKLRTCSSLLPFQKLWESHNPGRCFSSKSWCPLDPSCWTRPSQGRTYHIGPRRPCPVPQPLQSFQPWPGCQPLGDWKGSSPSVPQLSPQSSLCSPVWWAGTLAQAPVDSSTLDKKLTLSRLTQKQRQEKSMNREAGRLQQGRITIVGDHEQVKLLLTGTGMEKGTGTFWQYICIGTGTKIGTGIGNTTSWGFQSASDKSKNTSVTLMPEAPPPSSAAGCHAPSHPAPQPFQPPASRTQGQSWNSSKSRPATREACLSQKYKSCSYITLIRGLVALHKLQTTHTHPTGTRVEPVYQTALRQAHDLQRNRSCPTRGRIMLQSSLHLSFCL